MKHKLLLFVLLTASLPIFATGSIKERLSPNETLWFTYPARNWSEQALHIGNGYMGASFYGDVEKERFDIAEKTFWTGGPHSVPAFNYGVVKGGKDKIAAIRRSITDRRFAEADSLSRLYMVGDYTNYGYFSYPRRCPVQPRILLQLSRQTDGTPFHSRPKREDQLFPFPFTCLSTRKSNRRQG